MNYDQEIEKMYHPENFEPSEVLGVGVGDTAESSTFDLDLEQLFFGGRDE